MQFNLKSINAEITADQKKMAKNQEKINTLLQENRILSKNIKEREQFKLRLEKLEQEYVDLSAKPKKTDAEKKRKNNADSSNSSQTDNEKSESENEDKAVEETAETQQNNDFNLQKEEDPEEKENEFKAEDLMKNLFNH